MMKYLKTLILKFKQVLYNSRATQYILGNNKKPLSLIYLPIACVVKL